MVTKRLSAHDADELTLHHVPEWLERESDYEQPTRRSTVLPPRAHDHDDDALGLPAPPIRVAVRRTLLDDRLLVVRVLAPGAPPPPGTVIGWLRLDEVPPEPGFPPLRANRDD